MVTPRRERDWFDDLHEQFLQALAFCLPPDYQNKEPVVEDLHYHKEVNKYVRERSFRFSREFIDPEKERRFSEWHRVTTDTSVRRFFLLSILMYSIMRFFFF
jgi:hypothetical protein